MPEAGPVILEPIHTLKAHVPNDNTGDIMGDVTKRRGRVLGMEPDEDGLQTIIAEELNIPLAEVYGVVTFYAQFTLNPRGTYNIGVCMGTACYVKGAGDVLERIQKRLGIEPGGTTPDGRFSLEATRCIGACGLAPVMTINEDVYGRLTPDEVDKILDKYL